MRSRLVHVLCTRYATATAAAATATAANASVVGDESKRRRLNLEVPGAARLHAMRLWSDGKLSDGNTSPSLYTWLPVLSLLALSSVSTPFGHRM